MLVSFLQILSSQDPEPLHQRFPTMEPRQPIQVEQIERRLVIDIAAGGLSGLLVSPAITIMDRSVDQGGEYGIHA